MFESLMTNIDEETILLLKEKKADMYFLKTLIRFFDKKEILFKISMEDNYSQEEIDKFKNGFYICCSDNYLLSNEEREILDNIIIMMFYINKDDFIVSMK